MFKKHDWISKVSAVDWRRPEELKGTLYFVKKSDIFHLASGEQAKLWC